MPHRLHTALLGASLLLPACASDGRPGPPPLSDWERRTAEQETPDPATPADLTADADLAALQRHALAHNPGLRAAAQRWKAALERVPQADSLPDPRLTFGLFLEEVQTRTGPMEWRAGLSQRLPWPGDLDLAGRVALARAAAEGSRFAQRRLDLLSRLEDLWAERAWLDAALAITVRHRELLTRWEEVARTLNATGLGGEGDVIRAQVELATLDDRVRSLDDRRQPLAARVNALLDRDVGAALPRAILEERHDETPDGARWDAALATTSPALAALDAEVEAARLARDLAGSRGRPDTIVGVDYTRIGGGDDAVALTLGLDLPLWRGAVDAAERQGEAGLAAALAERRQAEQDLRADLQWQLYALRDAERRVQLYRDTLVTKGHEAVQSISAAYQAGDASFLDLIDAERVLLEFELAAARAASDRVQARAAVRGLTGAEPFPSHPTAAELSEALPAPELDP